jgi:hypothetical protein
MQKNRSRAEFHPSKKCNEGIFYPVEGRKSIISPSIPNPLYYNYPLDSNRNFYCNQK